MPGRVEEGGHRGGMTRRVDIAKASSGHNRVATARKNHEIAAKRTSLQLWLAASPIQDARIPPGTGPARKTDAPLNQTHLGFIGHITRAGHISRTISGWKQSPFLGGCLPA